MAGDLDDAHRLAARLSPHALGDPYRNDLDTIVRPRADAPLSVDTDRRESWDAVVTAPRNRQVLDEAVIVEGRA